VTSTNVLLTGASGFVGSHLLESMLELTNWNVVCVSSFRHNGTTDRIAKVRGTSYGRVHVITHDLTVPFSPALMKKLRDVHLIVNAASHCQVDASVREPLDFVSNNVSLMLNVLELARAVKPRAVLHLSTDEVYGPNTASALPWEFKPSSPYAASKAAQELICHAYQRSYQLPIMIASSANMFGERQSQLAFVPRVIHLVKNGDTVPIHQLNGKPTRRNYSYVRNVADHLVRLLRDEAHTITSNRIRRRALNGQVELDNLELAQRVAEGRKLRWETVDIEQTHPGHDEGYAPLTGGDAWKPEVSFDAALRRTVSWYMTHPEWLEA